MKRKRRRIKRRRITEEDLHLYSLNEIRSLILKFLDIRLQPEKKGFGQIVYNNSIPYLEKFLKENKKSN